MEKNNGIPLYSQLIKKIEDKIISGTWAKGEKIPSERELSKMYDVSRITVRSAIEELSRVGMLEKVHGKGTFVISKTIVQDLGGLYSFSDEMRKQGRIGFTKVSQKKVVEANLQIAQKLNIEPNSKIIYLERVRYDEDDKPLLLEKAYFPLEKYNFLLEESLEDYSLYEMLDEKYNISFDIAIEKFKAIKLKDTELKILNVSKDDEHFGMLIRRTTYKNNVIEYYSTLITLGDVFEFTIKLGNK